MTKFIVAPEMGKPIVVEAKDTNIIRHGEFLPVELKRARQKNAK